MLVPFNSVKGCYHETDIHLLLHLHLQTIHLPLYLQERNSRTQPYHDTWHGKVMYNTDLDNLLSYSSIASGSI